MLHYTTGDLLESEAEALVNTVNTIGVMGKGIALQFKNMFPNNFNIYKKACKNRELSIGQLLITEEEVWSKKKIVINFPTKTDWRLPSEYKYIELGVLALVKAIEERQIKSIAIPPLGAGNGGLDWNKVKDIIELHLSSIECDVYIYQPSKIIQENIKKERVKLTPARAMLLYVLYDLVNNGEFVSEFAAEKIAYFLQKFGAKNEFKLEYKADFYGPYSSKVRHVLHHLNGSYIIGYNSKDKKPFDDIYIIPESVQDVYSYLNETENLQYKAIADRTKEFLNGFYSSFSLELLSTIDYIIDKKNVHSKDAIIKELHLWSDRKKIMFNNREFINIATEHLDSYFYTQKI